MKNDKVTAEMFRKFLIDAFWDGNAILGKNMSIGILRTESVD